MSQEECIAGGATEHAENGEPRVRHVLGREAPVPDA